MSANRPQIKYGSQGDYTKKVQETLNANGYKLNVDGIFGDKTLAAVKDYQKKNGLAADGIVGENTWASLYGEKVSTPTASASGASSVTPKSYSDIDLSKYSSGYQKSDGVINAENKKLEAEDAVSNYGDFSYSNQASFDEIMNKILNREEFSYDLNGDALYQQYKDKYIQQGKMAMQDTMGQAAAMTGGYGNSYAATAGNQAYQASLEKLNDIIPELYQMALDKYNQEGQDLYNQYGMLSDDRSTEYGMWGDKYNQLVSDRDYYGNEANNAYAKDFGEWADQRDFDTNQYWNETNFGYQQDRDAVADRQWQAQFDEAKRQYDEQWAYQKEQASASSGGSGGSGGGSGGSGSGSGAGGNSGAGSGSTATSGVNSKIKSKASSFSTNSALNDYLNGLVADGEITEDQALDLYASNKNSVADLKDRKWTQVSGGGINWFGGVDNNAKVKDQYGNVYRLDDLVDALVKEGMSKKAAKSFVKQWG